MEIMPFVWILLIALLLITELLTVSFIAGYFAAGALFAFVLHELLYGKVPDRSLLTEELLVFFSGSVLLLLLTRSKLSSVFRGKTKKVPLHDLEPGKKAIAVEKITDVGGRIKAAGTFFPAITTEGEIEKGSKVLVVGFDRDRGLALVKKLEE